MKKYLVQGAETEARLNIIFDLTKIKSEEVQDALVDHLVKGHAESSAVALNGADQGNFNRALARINVVAGKIEEAKEHDWPGYRARIAESSGVEEHY